MRGSQWRHNKFRRSRAELRTLLYVEDNPANLMLVEDLIARRPDIHLLSAQDGNRGVEIARAALPDLILMDINLPASVALGRSKFWQRIPPRHTSPLSHLAPMQYLTILRRA